jgi:hypothetical protein
MAVSFCVVWSSRKMTKATLWCGQRLGFLVFERATGIKPALTSLGIKWKPTARAADLRMRLPASDSFLPWLVARCGDLRLGG